MLLILSSTHYTATQKFQPYQLQILPYRDWTTVSDLVSDVTQD